jgi:tetratricopeptide (TPR) repeat protein
MFEVIRGLIAGAHNQISLGQLAAAKTLLDEALRLMGELWDAQEDLRECELLSAEYRSCVGRVHDADGNYPRAFIGFAGALELRVKHLLPDHLDVLHARHDVGEILRVVGEDVRALSEFDEVVTRLRADSPVRDRRLLLMALKHSAYALLRLRRPDDAEQVLTEALELVDKPADRVDLLGALAEARREQGLDTDLGLLHNDLRELASSPDPTNWFWATVELAEAAEPRERVLMLSEAISRLDSDVRGELATMVGPAWSNLGAALVQLDAHGEALDAFLHSAEVAESVAPTIARVGPTHDRTVRPPWPVVPPIIGLLDRVTDEHRARSTASAYRSAAGWKCVQADVIRAQAELAAQDSPEATALLRQTRWLDEHGTNSEISAASRDLLGGVLTTFVPPEVVTRCFARSDTAALAKLLPQNGALVEFVRVAACKIRGQEELDGLLSHTATSYYVAFVVLPAPAEPVMVRLGDAETIEEAAARVSAAIPAVGSRHIRPVAKRPDDWRVAAAALAAVVWWPLRSVVGDRTEIFLAPDAGLCATPFDLLPDGPDGPPLLATRTTSLLATGRDLIRLTQRPNAASEDPVVIAAPEYGPPHAPYMPLTGALREGHAVANVLKVPLVLGSAASREFVMRLCRPEILHIASHAYAHARTPGDGPPRDLLRSSGIALASANAGGVLTALDALNLDLVGTDLVVLSACDSGLGPVGDGEGLLSLARSLFLSGARSVVWSLWKVNDHTTADLMADYYQRLLAGVPRARALADAKRRLFRLHPDQPQFWAVFVSQGDTHSLGRFRSVPIPREQWTETVSHYVDSQTVVINTAKVYSTHTLHLPDGADPLAVALISSRMFIGEAESQLYQAEQAFDAGRLDDAVEYARKALELDALVPAPLLAKMHARLTLFTASQGDLRAAEEHGRESVHRYEKLRFLPDYLATALDNLGAVLAHRGDFMTALALWERALNIKLDHLPVDQAGVDHTGRNIAAVGNHLAST